MNWKQEKPLKLQVGWLLDNGVTDIPKTRGECTELICKMVQLAEENKLIDSLLEGQEGEEMY